MTAYKLSIPEEKHSLFEFRQRNLPGFATVNSALKEFEPKTFFSWHLSVLIRYDDIVRNRLPSDDEQKILYVFGDKLDSLIKVRGNALFLARVTHDGHREIIWRVHNPDAADSILKDLLRVKDYPREFDYRMDEDPNWEKAQWYLKKAES
jgi:hypothetical protein